MVFDARVLYCQTGYAYHVWAVIAGNFSTHLFFRSVVLSFFRSLLHSLFFRFFVSSSISVFVSVHVFIRSLVHSFIHSFTCSFICSLIRSLFSTFVHSYIHSYTHTFVIVVEQVGSLRVSLRFKKLIRSQFSCFFRPMCSRSVHFFSYVSCSTCFCFSFIFHHVLLITGFSLHSCCSSIPCCGHIQLGLPPC